MLEEDEGLLHIPRNGDVDVTFFVVPIACDPKVPRALPFMWDGVVFFERIHEMLVMFFADAFHAKVIHTEAETDWAPVMLPEYSGDGALPISLCI